MKKVYTLAFLLFFTFGTMAQMITQTVRGVVRDKQNGITLPGANVILTHLDPVIGVATDADGHFRFENIAVGRISLMVTFIGYHEVVLNNLNLQAGKELVINIELEERVQAMDEVVITNSVDKTQTTNRMATVSARGFTVEETERYAGSRGDPAKMASKFAGVLGVDDSRNDIIIRGNSPLGLLWRFEGVDIPSPNHWGTASSTGGPVSMLNNTLLENSDFYTSAFPAEFGNALSGVFDLKMRRGNNERYEFLGQIGFNGFEIGGEGPIAKSNGSSFLANYRYSTLKVFDALGMDFGSVGVPAYQDLSFKIDFPGTRLGHISMFGLGGISDIEIWPSRNPDAVNYYGPDSWDISSGTNMGVVGISSHYTFNPQTYLKVTLAAMGQDAYTMADTLNDAKERHRVYQLNAIESKLSGSVVLNHKISTKHLIKGGITGKLLHSNNEDRYWSNAHNEYRKQVDYVGSSWLVQSYVQWQYKPTDNLLVNSGIHHNLYTFNNTYSLEPRVGLRYSFASNQSVSLGYGLHSQIAPPFIYFLQEYQDDGSYIQTNTELDLTRAHHLVLGYDWKINQFTRVKIETYYQHIFDAPVDAQGENSYSMLNNGASFEFSMSSYYLKNEGTGTNYGVELTLERFLNKGFYFLLTTSIFDSKYSGSDGVMHNSAFNNNYVVNALAGKEFLLGKQKGYKKHSLAIDMSLTMAGGKRKTPWTAVWNEEDRVYKQEWDFANAFGEKMHDYLKADLKIMYRNNRKGVTQEWGIDISNLLNYENVHSESFNETTGKAALVYQTSMMAIPHYRIIF